MASTLKKKDGDIVLASSTGRPTLIDGIEKLSQDVADALMTEYDSERGFGSQVTDNTIGKQARSGPLGTITRGILKSMVRDTIERLRDLQNQRTDQLTSFEAIAEIGIIRVYQTSKTGYIFLVDVVPFDGPDKITSTFLINLRHQFLNSAKPNLPGSVHTDDTKPY